MSPEALDGGVVHLAWTTLKSLLGAWPEPPEGWLSEAETARLASIATPARRNQFLAGRWLLRTVLTRAHGGQPWQWRLSAPEEGPPAVTEGVASGGPLHLALSHSGPVLACAIGAAPVGIDIEAPRRDRDIEGIAALCCDPQERAWLAEGPNSQRAARFYRIWTAKEAWLKQHADALSPWRLQQIHLCLAPSPQAPQIRSWAKPQWTLALAAAPGAPLRWHSLEPEGLAGWRVRDEARQTVALSPA